MIANWGPIFLTFKLAIITTLILIVIGLPLAYWLAFTKRRVAFLLETLVAMPLVLPPSVLGFYLLLCFSPQSFFGKYLQSFFDLRLVFSFEGLVFGSVIFSLPFMVQPIQAAFEGLSVNLRDASYTLGKSTATTFFKVLLPNIRPGLLTGIVLSFAHTVGEFGVVLMIGGSIPGQTKVASIAIYEEVEAMHYNVANQYAAVLFVVSFSILLVVNIINKKGIKRLRG